MREQTVKEILKYLFMLSTACAVLDTGIVLYAVNTGAPWWQAMIVVFIANFGCTLYAYWMTKTHEENAASKRRLHAISESLGKQ